MYTYLLIFRYMFKVQKDIARDFLFADGCALNTGTQSNMQESMNRFAKACDDFGLTISIKKTEVMYQPAPNAPYSEPVITVNGEKLTVTEKFIYLGSTLSRSVSIDEEVSYRIAKASSAFGRLREEVWDRRGISLITKLKVYLTVVLPSLLYACETWTVYSRYARQLNSFHMFYIKWQDKVPDTEVLQRAKMESVHAFLKRSQLRWAGHVFRMPDKRLPKRLLYGELSEGKRSLGGQKKQYKNTVKASLKSCGINSDTWEEMAQVRPTWRSAVSTGVSSFEAKRVEEQKQKRQRRKIKACTASQFVSTYSCPKCTRLFNARIGLISHLRTHETQE